MSHGDKLKRRRIEKEPRNNPKPGKGKCVFCGQWNPKDKDCPDNPNGHITLER